MRKDGLAGVARLRGHEVTQSEQALRNAALERQRAAEAAARIADALTVEAPESAPATYGAWLALQLALRQQARAAEDLAETREGIAHEVLVEARRAEKTVVLLREARAAEAEQRAHRREAAALDDIASRKARQHA